jgi:hypothetical protein
MLDNEEFTAFVLFPDMSIDFSGLCLLGDNDTSTHSWIPFPPIGRAIRMTIIGGNV